MRTVINSLLVLLTVLYPFAVFFGLEHVQPRYLALLLLLVFVLRLLLRPGQGFQRRDMLLLAVLLLFAGLVFTLNSQQGLLFYPVLINLFMLASFAATLLYPPSMIERFARIHNKTLPDHAIPYTRGVTMVWCLFFALNTLASAYTALFCPLHVWSLYNGLLAYGLVGLLFVLEYPVRLLYRRRHAG
ncbi:MAG TPA: hypothetical protein VIN71_08835 [Pseudomonadales bacterium]